MAANKVEELFDSLYQLSITDLERDEYHELDRPVVYLNQVKATLPALRDLLLERLPKERWDTDYEGTPYKSDYTRGFNGAVDEVREVINELFSEQGGRDE